MQVVGVHGPADAGRADLVERLVERLASDGTVGTVAGPAVQGDQAAVGDTLEQYRSAGAARAVGVDSDGGWAAGGEDRTVGDALEALAPAVEYAVLEGAPSAVVPTAVLGEGSTEVAGTVVARGDDAAAVDLEALVEAVEDADPFETLSSLVADVKRAAGADRAGAIATFTGRVRERDGPEDPPTEYLEFERYDAVAGERTAALREELAAREDVHAVRLHHRTGRIPAGEDIVFVVVLAGHRAAAFETVSDGIDRLKEEVPIFKREVTVDGEFWVHER